jgi:hypothetical protein
MYVKKGEPSSALSSAGERVEKPRLDTAVEPVALSPQSENPSSRAESIIDKRPVTVPVSSPPKTWNIAELSRQSDEIGLGGTNFPFGFNIPTSNRPGPNHVMESLGGLFNN